MPSLLDRFPVLHGSHESPDDGMCAMELVAWLAGEVHSDGPACTSPVIAAFVRAFNDIIPSDAGRSYYLRRWIPRLINTATDEPTEDRRCAIVLDFMVRTLLPRLLEGEGRAESAKEFAELQPIKSRTGAILAALAVRQESGHETVAAAIKLASRDRAPSTWVPTAAKMIQKVGTPEAFDFGTRLIDRLVRAGEERLALPPGRQRKSAPPTA